MNWLIKSKHRKNRPVIKSRIVDFIKQYSSNKFMITFTLEHGELVDWTYSSKAERDEEHERIINE